ncbi:unnamed protein product [Acanthoscelides obtectus]|uniref:Uncharacterized protein n=1 Tax=Acanthoscelides obtectus TaxID=200917 RepID=A0A9P0M272_ACAOB|nr:unnamed protein product [Acanthoscelides obtectus]CAK1655765.1 hypothetical protein AOBTE_LOCUS19315 [Acanthoscelides obtectus]
MATQKKKQQKHVRQINFDNDSASSDSSVSIDYMGRLRRRYRNLFNLQVNQAKMNFGMPAPLVVNGCMPPVLVLQHQRQSVRHMFVTFVELNKNIINF